jgi:hypothetical protein
VKRLLGAFFAFGTVVVCLAMWGPGASANLELFQGDDNDEPAVVSGAIDFKDVSYGTTITECPQSGKIDEQPKPLDRREKDEAEKKTAGGNDRRTNQDYSCLPQDETAIDRNPNSPSNLVAGANDYRLGWGTSGFYSSTDNGEHWYDGITPFPSLPSGDNLDGGGDPVTVFDRAGIAYYAQINFNRTDDTSGVWVNRSTNGGFTWTRPCVPIQVAPPPNEQSRCGGAGDPRFPGDGTVAFQQDNDSVLNGSVPGYDKEWITAGPRPAGVSPTCFTPLAHAVTPCADGIVGVDRLYVTYSLFSGAGSAQIFLSYSDDQARSWSPAKLINGSGTFCASGGRPNNGCDDSQGSEPTVNPTTGQLWVGFINGDTTDEDQYLVVTSTDGGQTFSQPSRVDTLYDVNEPRGVNGRADCTARGQGSTRAVLTNTCFRADPIFNAIVADKRGGDFANDVYVTLYDNRNGTIRSSNNDVFFYKSTDGGTTWIGPTRVNDDKSDTPANRDCGRNTNSIRGNSANCPAVNTGNDQFFPYVTMDQDGNLNVSFHDRRLDTTSTASEWPTSRTEPGNYLVWYWGAQCRISTTATVGPGDTSVPAAAKQCVAPEAVVNPSAVTGFNPGAGPIPGNGQNSATLPFRNFQISDWGTNFDYSFRAGLFAGDYSGNTAGSRDPNGKESNKTAAFWTDARNGRGSGGPVNLQPGRNPICEQSDVFFSQYDSSNAGKGAKGKAQDSVDLFSSTPCPADIKDKGAKKK